MNQSVKDKRLNKEDHYFFACAKTIHPFELLGQAKRIIKITWRIK